MSYEDNELRICSANLLYVIYKVKKTQHATCIIYIYIYIYTHKFLPLHVERT